MDIFEDDEPAPGGNAPEFSVSELSGAVKKVVEGAFDHVRVRGEVGRVSRPRSGHVYLDLKDDRAVLASVCWKGVAARLEVQPEEGMEVVATGRLTTFAGQSRYQLVIDSLAPAGVGALMAMLEKRKAALAAEGLFAAERKRPLPFLPRAVGVVTSPSGAVIRDILHRLGERFPMEVLVWPVAVQGKACAPEVAAAIKGFNALPAGGPLRRPDVLIIARGGGSVEDLWGFNEEIVARAAAASLIPLISAVGHETDTTLIDYVADRRAPTPTAAAEMAAPVRGELTATLAAFEERSARALSRGMEERRRRIRDLARALPRPEQVLAERRQRLDGLGERLPRALRGVVAEKRRVFAESQAGRFGPPLLREANSRRRERLAERARAAAGGLRFAAARARDAFDGFAGRFARQPARLAARVAEARARQDALTARLLRIGPERAAKERERLEKTARMLASLSHQGVLARGYAIVRSEGAVASSAQAVKPGAALSIEFSDGEVAAIAAGGAAKQGGHKGGGAPPRKRGGTKPGQQELDL